jgi:hypothetical protein
MFEEKGSLSEVPAIKIVLSIFEEELTGILYLKNAETLKVLYMNHGKLVWAMSNSPNDKIEDILIARGHSDAETIKNARSEGSVSSSIGKLLVEKGHLKLEQLVEVTKVQAGRIIKSVLSWDHGGYQFVKEPPPERMFTLDINLMNFIFNFVLKELDMTFVWREIRTARIHLERTKNQEKIDTYNLTEREMSFLENFTEGTSIESVLSRYAGSHRDTLLRFVFFFLSSGLLERLDIEDEAPEGEAVEEAPAESIGDLNGLFVDEKASEASLDDDSRDHEVGLISQPDAPVAQHEGVAIERLIDEEPVTQAQEEPQVEFSDGGPMEEAHEITHEEIDDIGDINLEEPKSIEPKEEPAGIDLVAKTPLGFDTGEASVGHEMGGVEESGDYMLSGQQAPDLEGPEDFDEDDLVTAPQPVPDKKKLKQFHYLIIFVILILIVGGVIFFLLPEDELDLDQGKNVVNVTERKPVVCPKKREKKETGTPKTVNKTENNRKTIENKSVSPKKTVNNTRRTPVKKTRPAADIVGIFRQGDYSRAGDLWRTEAVNQGVKYSILLELDCLKQSVANAFKECNDSRSFYILNIRRGNRNCFLVLWGRYSSEAEASAALGLIPRYFLRQQPPARVIDLQKYL